MAFTFPFSRLFTKTTINRIIPLLDRILVKKILAPTKTEVGVLLPETAVPMINEGIVEEIGKGARDQQGKLIPLNVKKGDRVLLPDFGGSRFTIEKNEFVLIRDSDILGILQ